MTKDSDFLYSSRQIWRSAANNLADLRKYFKLRLKGILTLTLEDAIQLLEKGEKVVEINSI